MTQRKIIIGTRGSRLALIQAEAVISELKKKFPEETFEIKKIVTGGDRDRKTELGRVEGIGFFTRELEEALLESRIDLAVHSLKDMPTIIPDGLSLASTLERADPRDVLVTRGEPLEGLKPGARIGTSSPRRSIQLAGRRPDLEAVAIRGNIETRLNKITKGEVDGVILAAAAMIRLGRDKEITQYLPADDFLPSAGQGAIALEIRGNEDYLSELASRINHIPTWSCVNAERAFLSTLGGGCKAPIAALAVIEKDILRIRGMAASMDGARVLNISGESAVSAGEETAKRLAQELLEKGASEFIEEAANGTW